MYGYKTNYREATKKKKHIAAFLLVLVLFMGMSTPAYAVKAQYATTASFLEALSEDGVKYNYKGVDQDDEEEVTVSYAGDYMDSIRAVIFFDEELDSVSMRIWDVIAFDEDDYFDVLKTVNSLNYKYKYAYFVVDEEDWTVYATIDVPLRDCDEAGEIAYDALYYLVEICDRGYDELKEFEL